MKLTPAEAAAALATVERTEMNMRHVIRAHRGHFHLWIWGIAWIVMPMLAWRYGEAAVRHFPAICASAGVLSFIVGFVQGLQVRTPVNWRLVGGLVAVVAFGCVFPTILRPAGAREVYLHVCLVAMQAYIIAGLWTDTYLLAVGVIITALILIGWFAFPALFWPWMAFFGGGTLVATGVYVRFFWR